MALLAVSGLYKAFDGVPAVDGVSFSAGFHLLVVIGGGKVYQVLHELLPKNRFEPGAPTRSAAPATGPSQVARLNQSLRVP